MALSPMSAQTTAEALSSTTAANTSGQRRRNCVLNERATSASTEPSVRSVRSSVTPDATHIEALGNVHASTNPITAWGVLRASLVAAAPPRLMPTTVNRSLSNTRPTANASAAASSALIAGRTSTDSPTPA